MISTIVSEAPIVVGLIATAHSPWREALASLPSLGIKELALFLREMDFDFRRELYQALDAGVVTKIPWVELPLDAREWEILYLSEKFGTNLFSLPADQASAALVKEWGDVKASILIENPEKKDKLPFFTSEFLSQTSAVGVCLDTAALERNRVHDKKSYDAVISTLDHNAVSAALVAPIAKSALRRFLGRPNRLLNLSDLHYLKHFPQAYLSKTIALKLDNSFEEQLEVRAYLQSFFRKTS